MAAAVCTCAALLLIIPGSDSRVTGAVRPLMLTAVEGEDVTLSDGNDGTSPLGSSVVLWLFNKETIAQKRNGSPLYHIPDKLDLDVTTGSLTIHNISVRDSGDYRRIDFNPFYQGRHQLNVTGRSVNGTDPGIGGTVTLCAGFKKVPKYSIIAWDFVSESTQRIAECLRLPGRSDIRYSGDANLRLNLNRINASLTITDLKTTDSGTYLNTILNKAVTSDFQLRVLAPVSKPHIRKLGKSSGECWVQCTVKNGDGVNLFWYRENKRISNTSSSDLKMNLTLPLNISEYISTYRCVASNPAGNLTAQFNKDALCPGSSVRHVFWMVIAIVILLFVGIILFGKFLRKQKYCVL